MRHPIDRRQQRRLADQQERHRRPAAGLEIQQQPQGLERLAAVQQVGLVDGHHRVPALLGIGGQEPLDAADARLQAGVCAARAGAVEFVGQIGQQIGGRHLRKDEVDKGVKSSPSAPRSMVVTRVLPTPDGPASSAAPRRFSTA